MNLAELFDCIRMKNNIKVDELITRNPKCVNEYFYGTTPFMYAIECGAESIALEICTKTSQLDLNLLDNLNIGCLEKAVEARMYSLVQAICDRLKPARLNEIIKRTQGEDNLLIKSIKFGENQISIALIKGLN
jgi:hypothetical protein